MKKKMLKKSFSQTFLPEKVVCLVWGGTAFDMYAKPKMYSI